MNMTTFLSNRAIYETVIRDTVPQTRERLWIATADIKVTMSMLSIIIGG